LIELGAEPPNNLQLQTFSPQARKYLAGIGLQYGGVGMVASIRAVDPTIKSVLEWRVP
jgi:hypothetical protein